MQQQHQQRWQRRRYWLPLLEFCATTIRANDENKFQAGAQSMCVCAPWRNLNFKHIAAMMFCTGWHSFVHRLEGKIVGKSQHWSNLSRSYCLIFSTNLLALVEATRHAQPPKKSRPKFLSFYYLLQWLSYRIHNFLTSILFFSSPFCRQTNRFRGELLAEVQ